MLPLARLVLALGAAGAPPVLTPAPPPLPEPGAPPATATLPSPGADAPGAPVPSSGDEFTLRRLPSGEYTHDHDWWSARIARDGSVAFENHRFRIGVRAPLITSLPDLGKGARDWQERKARLSLSRDRPDPNVYDRNERTDPFYRNRGAERATLGSLVGLLLMPSLTIKGDLDLNDEILRLLGEDPYRRQKAKFLAVTSEMRIRMAVDRQRELLRESLADLPAWLDKVWANPTLAPRERRRIVTLLGEECRSDPDGKAAHAIIEAFLARHTTDPAPAPSPAAEPVPGAPSRPAQAPPTPAPEPRRPQGV